MKTINQNFKTVVDKLLKEGNKITNIAKAMGYTTTTQIYKPMKGEAGLTSTALQNFVEAFYVRPEFLFNGKGNMFITENPDNIGYVIYNPESNVYLGASDCFVSKLRSANVYGDEIHAKSVMYNFKVKAYADNPFAKNLLIRRILIEIL
jgi:hypothetical protein